jgi:hypothetical protein
MEPPSAMSCPSSCAADRAWRARPSQYPRTCKWLGNLDSAPQPRKVSYNVVDGRDQVQPAPYSRMRTRSCSAVDSLEMPCACGSHGRWLAVQALDEHHTDHLRTWGDCRLRPSPPPWRAAVGAITVARMRNSVTSARWGPAARSYILGTSNAPGGAERA